MFLFPLFDIIKNMYDKSDKNSIKELFNNISNDYDFINNLMSFSFHKKIKSAAIKNLPYDDNLNILDLCTGTGDIAIMLSRKYTNSQITAVDFSEKMLNVATEKTKNIPNITLKNIDITSMPFEENSFDLCFISFGLRNLPDIDNAIFQIERILKPGGTLTILDLGKPKGLIKPLYDFYFSHLIPLIGKIFHNDKTPYNYLVNSLKTYPSQDELINILINHGFAKTQNIDYFSGIIAQQIGQKQG